MITIEQCQNKSKYGLKLTNRDIDTCYRNIFEMNCKAEFKNEYGLAKVDKSMMQDCIKKQFHGLPSAQVSGAVSLSIFAVLFAAVLILFASRRKTIQTKREELAERDEYSFRVFV